MKQQRKTEMRREMKLVLGNLDKRWEAAANPEACQNLTALVARLPNRIEHVLAWVPCFPGEVDLAGFIAEMLRTRAVYLPRVEERGIMSFVRVTEEWASRLEPGSRGVLQPESNYGEPFISESGQNVLVVVPGLAFDRCGRRLGRGRGYYDRFLADPELQEATRIGVCWSMQIVPEIPTDHYDIEMQYVCHERAALEVAKDG